MRRARHIVCLAAALLAATALVAPAHAGKADNSVRIATRIVLQNADPYFNISYAGTMLAGSVWDTLLYRDPQTGELKGDLATAWRRIDDKTLELDLRQGVKFHNGAEFDADDVVYTFNFVVKPQNKVPSNVARWIDHAEKTGKYTVRVVARQALPTILADLAQDKLVIHPHDYYAKAGPKGMNEHPIGTGPYRVVEHALGKYIRLERNDAYFKGGPKPPPKIGRVEIRYIPDQQTRVAEIAAGSADLVTEISRDQADQLQGVRGLQIVAGESASYSVLRMNTLPASTAPQLRDLRVRQAIMHAIDRETMTRHLIGGGSRVIHAECHPSEFGCVDTAVPRYGYDPARARALLMEAGYPKGFDIDIYAFRDRLETEAITGYLNAVGIRARLHFLEQAAFTAARRAGRVAFAYTSWSSSNLDASTSMSPFHEFSIDDFNRDPEIRNLLLKADASMDEAVRKDAYAKALKLVGERAYVMPLYTLPVYYVAANGLDLKLTAGGNINFYEMSWK